MNLMLANIAPLKSSMMAASIIGFLISSFYLYPLSMTWGFTLALFFGLLFVATIISMTYGPIVMDVKGRK